MQTVEHILFVHLLNSQAALDMQQVQFEACPLTELAHMSHMCNNLTQSMGHFFCTRTVLSDSNLIRSIRQL